MMFEYPKIQTVFLRDPETHFKTLLWGQWAKPEFEILANTPWVATEKVDGTNVRIAWTIDNRVVVAGRTDAAQLPPGLTAQLLAHFTHARFAAAFPDLLEPTPSQVENGTPARLVLYGEGYGAGIQKGGGLYRLDQGFVLFDVLIDRWQEWPNVQSIARTLNTNVVPITGTGTLRDMVEGFKLAAAQGGAPSLMSGQNRMAEGLVFRPRLALLNRNGERVIAKMKFKDFGLDHAQIVAPVEEVQP